MSITLRKPVSKDAVELATLHVECWKQTYSQLLPVGYFTAEHLEQRISMWHRLLGDSHPGVRIAVASDRQDRLVGFSFSAPLPKDAIHLPDGIERQLYNLYVLNDHHGSGTGQQLLEAVLGDEPAMLWVAEKNPRAIAFYRRNGFAFDGLVEQDPTAPLITDARMVRLPEAAGAKA
ncbi:GNAT family N-acetyltransferase [Glutamicibacter sp. JL.03c]|uniref:GNAT family N-acetyltransferase n=1 Tax=Glutamicibacter sp. JL.03c TaxID=2984842 RepID=UPI0021F7143A|nr:GNAT family N-acetyltransferase [Glutamicibacter sp. JL.03c]UYQ78958.1 GNAT family N-acetyltransferase [Glutamicibacter sp. JL.03c]